MKRMWGSSTTGPERSGRGGLGGVSDESELVIDLRDPGLPRPAETREPKPRSRHVKAMFRFVERHREFFRMTIDVSAWIIGFVLASWLRFDFSLSGWSPDGVVAIFVFAALFQLLIGIFLGLYAGRWRFGSFEEVAAVVRSTGLVGVVVVLLDLLASNPRLIPLSVAAGGTVVALVVQLGFRYLWRLFLEMYNRPGVDAERVIVYGAGEGGDRLITSMLRNPISPYRPVALLDDDPGKRKAAIAGCTCGRRS